MGEITAKEIVPIDIEKELKQSYLDYAMSVIVGRALPDARDGLKPVHRRALYAMHVLNNDYGRPHKKSARIVGDIIGKYHPHGDSAAYETIVRMAQWWSLRYPLVDGQGNFGSMDGDGPAAQRYTEVRMAKISQELLADLDKETVNFVENYDGTETMPEVLPTKVPNMLVNGSAGIAVGMATNMAPHNLNETLLACLAFIDNPDISTAELMEFLPGPDFPTGGIINGKAGIVSAYESGKGRVKIRAKTHFEDEEKDKAKIVITEMPYQVNKSKLIEKIAELSRDKKLEGIRDIRDESDKDGVRVVIDLKSGHIQENYKDERRTEIQDSSADLSAEDLITPEDRVVTISHEGYAKTQPLEEYRAQRRGGTGKTAASVKDEDFVEQLLVANTHTTLLCFSNLGQVYWLKVYEIPSAGRAAKGRPLVNLIQLSEGERITSMVPVEEYDDNHYVLMATKTGTVKKTVLTEFSNQRKGGKRAITLQDGDELVGTTVTDGSKFVMLVSNAGKAAHFSETEVRSMGRTAKGVRGIKLDKDQYVISLIIPEEDASIFTVSENGYGKRSKSIDFRKTRRGAKGVIAMQVSERNGQLIGAAQVTDDDEVMLISNKGMLVRTKVSEVNVIGRNTQGVTVIRLKDSEKLISIAPISEEFIGDDE